jgi:hypothetical protein
VGGVRSTLREAKARDVVACVTKTKSGRQGLCDTRGSRREGFEVHSRLDSSSRLGSVSDLAVSPS